jgi:lipid A 3-O-deacylase
MKSSMPSKCLGALAAMLIALPCLAIDAASIELGGGDEVRMVRLGVQSHWQKRWFQSNGTHLGGYWNATIGHWRGNAYRHVYGQHQNIGSIGLTPVLRFQSDHLTGWYAEAGIGANLLSRLYENNGDHLSTRFQFNDHVGAGYVFKNGWDVGIKFEHFSNGGIKKPNSGVNFVLFKVARPF